MTAPRSRSAHASITSWRAQTRPTTLRTSEVARTTARFAFPWSLAAGEVLRVSLSIYEVIRPLSERGSPQRAPDPLAYPRPCSRPSAVASGVHRRAAGDLTAA